MTEPDSHRNFDPLISKIRCLMTDRVAKQIDRKIREFKALHSEGSDLWFSELCFCILTANSSARLGMTIQEAIGPSGFLRLPEEELERHLRLLGHRFAERRAHFIVQAREYSRIRDIVVRFADEMQARDWLAKEVMGLGYKEASHFLRNVGYDDLAILDRHILRTMHDHGLLEEIPKSLTRSRYMELEARLRVLGVQVGMPLSKLDLYLWYMKTGTVLK